MFEAADHKIRPQYTTRPPNAVHALYVPWSPVLIITNREGEGRGGRLEITAMMYPT